MNDVTVLQEPRRRSAEEREAPDAFLRKGDRALYWSNTYEQWMETEVQKAMTIGSRLFFDLTCKPKAEASRVKPTADAYRVGDQVSYWSETHRQWMEGFIQCIHSNWTFFDLNIKARAPAERIFPKGKAPKDEPPPDLPSPPAAVAKPLAPAVVAGGPDAAAGAAAIPPEAASARGPHRQTSSAESHNGAEWQPQRATRPTTPHPVPVVQQQHHHHQLPPPQRLQPPATSGYDAMPRVPHLSAVVDVQQDSGRRERLRHGVRGHVVPEVVVQQPAAAAPLSGRGPGGGCLPPRRSFHGGYVSGSSSAEASPPAPAPPLAATARPPTPGPALGVGIPHLPARCGQQPSGGYEVKDGERLVCVSVSTPTRVGASADARSTSPGRRRQQVGRGEPSPPRLRRTQALGGSTAGSRTPQPPGRPIELSDLQMSGPKFDMNQTGSVEAVLRALALPPRTQLCPMQGFRGGMNQGIWFSQCHGMEDFVLKLVPGVRVASAIPTEAENFVKLQQTFPNMPRDPALAFPCKIVSMRDLDGVKRQDLIAMRKVPGERLATWIATTWSSKQDKAKVLEVLENLAASLADFHRRYGNMQHGDFQPSNIFFHEASSSFYFIDVGGMGIPTMGTDVEHFLRSLVLISEAYGRDFAADSQDVFERGYQRAVNGLW